MYHSSVNTCQNQVKLCTLKVQVDVQLAIPNFCLSIKDCQSQISFKDFMIKPFELTILVVTISISRKKKYAYRGNENIKVGDKSWT